MSDLKYLQSTKISEEGTRQLVDQMVKLGYFHESRITSVPLEDNLETFRKLQKDPAHRFTADMKCRIIMTVDGSEFYTRGGLVRALVEKLETLGGRKSTDELAGILNVNPNSCNGSSSIQSLLPSSVQLFGSEFISKSYWNQLRETIQTQVQAQGSLSVLELARQHSVPLETLLVQCLTGVKGISFMGDSKVLVSDVYLDELQLTVICTFRKLTAPTLISTVCQDHGWDLDSVMEWLVAEVDGIGGEVHADATSTKAAMFLPKAYSKKQHMEILDFVAANGYMTAERANDQGMPMTQMVDVVKESFPDAIVLGDVLILDLVLQNVQVAIQDCEAAGSIDFQEYLDAELTSPDLLQMLLNRAGFSSDNGIAVIVDGRAMLISRARIKHISEKVIPPLINDFSKKRAPEIFESTPKLEEEEETAASSSKKGKSKFRKAKHSRSKKSSEQQILSGVVPLLQVAGAVLREYPSFFNETQDQELLDQADNLNWEDEENSGNLLIEFCKMALYTDLFRSKCGTAVQAEILSLQSAKESKSILSRKDAAAKVRSVEAAFEDVFVPSCYMIQAVAKFIALASNSNHFEEASLKALQNEFLEGCCADLTSRITQYCLFQNEDDQIFSFQHHDAKSEEESERPSSLPACCETADSAARRFPKAFLSCPPPREPLPVLRESLAGSSGVTLARQWVLCGGGCYRGGIRLSEEDGSEYTRPGSMDGYLRHVEENCLTLCGLPFKKLDKKSEKKFLFARRQSLTQSLQIAADSVTILELTIMILFQQVKQMCVAGTFLRGPILKMLVDEKKISAPVATALETLNEEVNKGEIVSEELVEIVKECGLCRDIGKHEIM